MKIALFGYGKMGKLIEQLAPSYGHKIIAAFSKTRQPSVDALKDADVCIDFSHGEAVLNHVNLCIKANKPLIIGTTGWESQLDTVKDLIQTSSIGCLYAPNFSIGIHLFSSLISYLSKLMNTCDEYDVSGIEYHHRQKLDHPSGTAKALALQINQELKREQPLEFASIRCGHIPGTHIICFDSPVDTITVTHQARNREGFAHGALKAANWIIGKQGFFTIEDLIAQDVS